jgi:hypothetical protein
VRLFGSGCLGTLAVLAFAPSAWAGSARGCELSSEVRAGDGLVRGLQTTSAALGEGLVYVASRPEDGTIVMLVPYGDAFRELGLYWPTPTDPVYAYRRMSRLPRNTTLLGNDSDQTIIVLRAEQDFLVNGLVSTYRPIRYAGSVLSIDGCGGDDDIEGGDGSDHLFDYSGENQLRGFGGRDWLEGTGVLFSGGEGDDCITGNGGSEFADISGDEGDDVLEVVGSFGATSGGPGADTCSASNVHACETLSAALCLGWL